MNNDQQRLQELKAEKIIKETVAGELLGELYYELTFYHKNREQHGTIHNTLVSNFVNKATDGIQVTLTNETPTHELLMQVLQAYSQQLKQSTPVKTTEATK